jgi:RNA polymerase sigma-70 factor (ECF subfamily)
VAAVPLTPGVATHEAAQLRAAAAGDRAAVRWLLDEVAPTVFGFLFARVGGNRAVAEDLLQETLLEVVRSAADFRGDAAAATWVCAIARRRLARHYERERRAEVAQSQLRLVLDEDADKDTAADVERRDEVTRALGRLPALHRQVLVLKYLDQLSVQQIGDQLGRSTVQVQSLLQRARDGLRRELSETVDD